jgi:hypothetical protein
MEDDGQQVLVVAHSAGGVLTSFAASRISIPASMPRTRVEVMP